MNKNMKQRKGFTTVELVIVIAVIAILATVLIPTFSNLIEKANLSSDKQNVRNMNICLTTEIASKIKADKPEHFGTVREMLEAYGYGKDDNFKAKTKGHSFRWFIDDRGDDDKSNDRSVILLVNAENDVIFPEEYKTIGKAENVRKFFDMSLPAATVENAKVPGTVFIKMFNKDLNLAVKYTFDANNKSGDEYIRWLADYYITVDLPAGNENREVDVALVGSYENHEEGAWQVLPMQGLKEGSYKAVLDKEFSYQFIRGTVDVFQCGVIDPNAHADLYTLYGLDAPPAGTVMKVELRLTDLNNTDNIRILGVFEYEFE